jgi:hypothetical protein
MERVQKNSCNLANSPVDWSFCQSSMLAKLFFSVYLSAVFQVFPGLGKLLQMEQSFVPAQH